jgi:putative oxidoreductase
MTTLMQTWSAAPAESQSPQRSRVVGGVLWALQIVSAAMFLFAGGLKLAGVPVAVQQFGVIGLGQWFRYLTGTIEVVSAVLLLIPSLAGYGAAALAVTMVGAIATHLFILGGSPLAAIILLASTSAIAWARRSGR